MGKYNTTLNYDENGGKKVISGTIDIQGQMLKNGAFFVPARQKTIIDSRVNYNKKGVTAGVTIGSNTYYAGTARLVHSALVDCYDLKLLFANAYTLGDGSTNEPLDLAGPNDITIYAGIEYGGAVYRALFNGQPSITLKPGQFIESDSIGIYISKGETFATRTYSSVGASNKWAVTTTTNTAAEGFIGDTDYSGVTTAVTVQNPGVNVFAPIAVLGSTASNNGNIAVIGDSIGMGYNGSWGSVGYAELALRDAGLSFTNIARSGEKAKHFVTNQLNVQYRSHMLKYCNAAIVNYGINDVNDSTQTADMIKTNLMKIWTNLANRGIKVFQCTITPRALAGNAVDATYNPKRIEVNDWIRAVQTSVLSGVFDIADLAETSRNSGIWKAGLSTDLLHPNDTGYTALKPGIDVSKFKVAA